MKYRSFLIRAYLLIGLTLGGCLKSEDNTPTGPKVFMNVANFAINTPVVTVSFDGMKFNATALAYGTSTATTTAFYNPLGAGIKELNISNGATTYISKNNVMVAGSYYSLLLVDSLKNNTLKTVYLKEDTTTIDTLGRARWLHLLPGKDTLTAYLRNAADTVQLAFKSTYNIEFNNVINSAAFDKIIKPGTYQLLVFNRGALLSNRPTINIKRQSLYSFIVSSPQTGTTEPTILFWQNK